MAARKAPSASKVGKVEKRQKTGGRKAGTPNKFTGNIKDAVLETFYALGGVKHMTKWARESPTDFYRICSKLIPTQITADVRHVTAEDMTDDELTDIATAGRAGTTEAPRGEKELH